jgi:hypothetical protein
MKADTSDLVANLVQDGWTRSVMIEKYCASHGCYERAAQNEEAVSAIEIQPDGR